MEEELDEPPPFRGEVVFSHIGEDIGPETSKSNLVPFSQANTADLVAIKTESLSHAKPITPEEFSKLIALINKTEDNALILKTLEDLKKPFLFSSANLSELLEITPSIKTKISMIRMIAPRLSDPRAKSEYFIGLFRFSEQKDIVKAALKSRMHTLNSAMFSRTEHSLFASPNLEDSSVLSSQSRIRSRRRSRVSLHATMNRNDAKLLSKIHENSKSDDGNDDTTLPTTSRESSQNDVGSAMLTPLKASNNAITTSGKYHKREEPSSDDYLYSQVASPMSVETVCSDRSDVDDIERSFHHHNIQPFSPSNYPNLVVNDEEGSHLLEDETSVFLDYGSSRQFDHKNSSSSSTVVQSFHSSHHTINNLLSASSQVEYANNNFSSHAAKAQISEKAAHRNTVNLTSTSLLRRSHSVEDILVSNRHSDTELFESSNTFNSQRASQSQLLTSSPLISDRLSTVEEPEPIEGWLNKYSRRGLFKNWRLRYFTLRAGKLSYYSEKLSPANLKGEVLLKSALIEVEQKKSGRRQFTITFKSGGGASMLMEAGSDDIADEWVASLREHITFCSYS
mmetsp:Transcript_22096/g.31739  ORF Transcript_22096/g.31739 Transcript_22096/m.31739 type:complete len:566 (+) Transcript_22096:39-1736(+)